MLIQEQTGIAEAMAFQLPENMISNLYLFTK